MKVSTQFRDAEALADFANLDSDDAARVSYFRQNYPDFAPAIWWDYKIEDWPPPKVSPAWEEVQYDLRRTWENSLFKFEGADSGFILVELINSVGLANVEDKPEWEGQTIFDGSFETRAARAYGFHRGLMYLFQHDWTPRTCKSCGRYFVANHPKREHCQYLNERGETCRQIHDRERHLANYYARAKKQRQMKAKARAAAKAKHRSKAKR